MSFTRALPFATSSRVRMLFLLSAGITAAVMFAANSVGSVPGLSSIFVTLFVYRDYAGAVGLLLILLAALFVPESVPARSLLLCLGASPKLVAICTAAVLSLGSLLIYRNHPLAMDEYAQFFQSQIFAHGHLSAHFPPALLDWLVPEGFQNQFLTVSKETGAVASAYWPGFALLLTPFTFLGVPWVCNPIITGVTLIAFHRLAIRIFASREAAGLTLLLTLASPEFLADGISYYSMPTHLLANSVFALLLLDPTPRHAFLAGIVGSVALTLHNPVPHMLFALPWLAWLATRTRRLHLLGAIAAGYAPLCLLLGVGWFWFTSALRETSLDHLESASAHLGEIQHVFAIPDVTNLLARMIGLAKIWAWALPGLPLLALIGAWRSRHDTACTLLSASALSTFAGYLFVAMDQGHGWGFRYFHSAWVALPLLGTAAIHEHERAVRAFVVGCAVLTLLLGTALRASQIHSFISAQMAQVPAYAGDERRVVIIDPTVSYYAADLVQNDPYLQGTVIRMITRGSSQDAQMMRAYFPGMRRVYADKYGSVWSTAPADPRSAPGTLE